MTTIQLAWQKSFRHLIDDKYAAKYASAVFKKNKLYDRFFYEDQRRFNFCHAASDARDK